MRKIIVSEMVSVDGFYSGPNGELDWHVVDEEFNAYAKKLLDDADILIFGRRTYEMFASFWPRVLEESASSSAASPHGPGYSPQMRAMAVWLDKTPKLVFSRTLAEVGWRGARLLRQIDAAEIEALKRQPGENMIMFGSGQVASRLTELGLIDEYQLVVNPLFLGSGRALLGAISKSVRLELLEAKSFASGNVMLRYAPTARH